MDEIRFVAATGAVGAGVDRASLAAAMKREPHFMAADAGTTDAGPAALRSAVPALARDAAKADLPGMLAAGHTGHVRKCVECGTLVCEPRGLGVMLARIRRDHAIIEPIGPDLRCTPMTVAAHSLYENPDLYLFHEASGTLDIRNAVFHAETDTSVRISGAQFHPAEKYNVKLEGAELAGYATVMIGGIRDPFILSRLDVWLGGITQYFEHTVEEVLGLGPDDYQFALHTYGRDRVMGELEPERESQVHEVGVVFEVLAAYQRTASEIQKLARPPLPHFPVPECTGPVATILYLHKPPQLDRRPVYRFNMHHVVTPRTREEMFRIESIEVGAGSAAVRARTA